MNLFCIRFQLSSGDIMKQLLIFQKGNVTPDLIHKNFKEGSQLELRIGLVTLSKELGNKALNLAILAGKASLVQNGHPRLFLYFLLIEFPHDTE